MGLAAAAFVYAAVTLLLFHNLLPNITTDLYPDLGTGLIPSGAMVIDLDNVFWNARAQYRAVMGHYRSVNGYSGYSAPGFDAFAQDVIKRRDQALEVLRRRETVYVVVASEQDPSLPPWVAAQPGVERVGGSGEFVLYRLPELH